MANIPKSKLSKIFTFPASKTILSNSSFAPLDNQPGAIKLSLSIFNFFSCSCLAFIFSFPIFPELISIIFLLLPAMFFHLHKLKISFLAFSPEKRGEAVSKPKTKNFF